VFSSGDVGACTGVWRVFEGSRLTDWCVVGVLIGVMKREEMYILWVAVGWKLGTGRLDKCPRSGYCTTFPFMRWVG